MFAALLLSALLNVPYLAQPPDLCGGAAVAMVMRYWGARDVFPQDFAPLVSANRAGIPTNTLISAVRDRRWTAVLLPTDTGTARSTLRSHINDGQPLIALIEVQPTLYHYVVLVGMTDDDVVVHDPAVAPFRVLRWAEFERAWAAADHWALLMLPPDDVRVAPVTVARERVSLTGPTADSSCAPLVAHGIQLATDGDADASERTLLAAMALCPADPSAALELAGLRFSQQRWEDAERLSLSAIRLAPDDAYAWTLVASSRFVRGDAIGALAAWNHVAEPRIDTINIHGAVHTPQSVILNTLGLEPRALLTPALLRRAEQRARALPATDRARVAFTPLGDGRATVDVSVAERPLIPQGWWSLARAGVHAWIYDEVALDAAGAFKGGDAESVAWRWSSGRPRVQLSLALPSPRQLPGNVAIDLMWEQQTYAIASPDLSGRVRDTRRRAGLHMADWPIASLQWRTGVALDRFGARDYINVDAALDWRASDDRLAVVAMASAWVPATAADRFAITQLAMSWRSTAEPARAWFSAQSSVDLASGASPRALWAGAGTGDGRDLLLRAHPLLHDNIIDGAAIGRTLAHAGLEYSQPILHLPAGGVALAGFIDSARAWRRFTSHDASRWLVDAGVGVRVRAPGAGQSLRVDLAHGLHGGAFTLSAGWTTAWPH